MAFVSTIRARAMTANWIVLALAAAGLGVAFFDGLAAMVRQWGTGEYSHGWMIPVVAVWLVMLKHEALGAVRPKHQWAGFGLVAFGLLLAFAGEIATIYTVIQYAFIVVLAGLAIAVFGTQGALLIWGPLVYLVFMVPLPMFFEANLSSQLQLLSSGIGVFILRLLGISVFLDGNIIDLGNYKLQVAEACSGLRYLFPFISFGYLCGYIYRGPFWHKVILFIATIPIAVVMNSFRIAAIGVLTNVWGTGAAEGFIHYFEGWVVFLICLVLLFTLAWSMMRVSKSDLAIADAFVMDVPPLNPTLNALQAPAQSRPFIASTGIILLAALLSFFVAQRVEIVPSRQSFFGFPLAMGEWRGQDTGLPPEIVEALKVTDYLSVDYVNARDGGAINLYIAYYESQRKGASVHSPRSCIPGGGWEIERIGSAALPINGQSRPINRLVIAKGTSRQLVYYWFQQRGRRLTNEYLVKWYILVDGIAENRTDGSLVRIITPMREGESEEAADARLTRFAQTIDTQLDRFIPN